MAFTGDTKILTSRGWKPIAEISGRDRVLVRNFIGDAEFIQPFALKKSRYEGEMYNFGNKYWAVTVTPDHRVIYDTKPEGTRATQYNTTAKDVVVDKHRFLYRRFRYIREDRPDEYITLYGDVERKVAVSDEDWYTLVAYVVTKGYISKDKNPRLKFMVEPDTILSLVSLLDNWGVTWSLGQVNGSLVVTVNRDNNIARKLKVFLGARARRDMQLPYKMVYGSSQALARKFLGTFTTLAAKPSQKRPNQLVFSTINAKLVESLKMMSLFCGYSFSATENNGNYVCYVIPEPVSPWSVRFVDKVPFSGDVYEIDLFEGMVYVTQRSLPVWMSPK